MLRVPVVFLLLLMLVIINARGQQLSRQEKQFVDFINNNMPQTIERLKQVVNINSGSLNTAGVKEVGNILKKDFDAIGFNTEWVDLPDTAHHTSHLVASIKGKKGKKLFLIGHLDTVFEPDMPANPYRQLNDSIATGQGVNDIKGGDLVIVAALQALQHFGLLKNASITAYFTGDEERSSLPASIGRADFIARAKQCDMALAFESAQGLNTVASARRGSSSWTLTVSGHQAHSSRIFNGNYGAIYEAARVLNTFREQLSTEQYLTFNPGVFAGGSDILYDSAKGQTAVAGKTNIISPIAVVQGDLRFLREAQKDSAREKMKAIVTANNLPGTTAAIVFHDGIPSMEPTAGNQKLVELVNNVGKDMGLGETAAGDPGGRGAGDVSYVAQYLDCLDGLGASGKGSHAPGETINLNEYPRLIQRAAVLIYRLIKE